MALGELRGDHAFVLRSYTLRGSGDMFAEVWDVPLDGEPRLALRYRVGPHDPVDPLRRAVLARQLSPDGRRIALELPSYDTPETGLNVVDLEDGTARTIVGGAGEADRWSQPAWRPGSEEIAFALEGPPGGADLGVMLIDARSGQMTDLRPPATHAPRHLLFGWTPDGVHLGFGVAWEGVRYDLLDVATGRKKTVCGGSLFSIAAADWRGRPPELACAFAEGPYGGAQMVGVGERTSGIERVLVTQAMVEDGRGSHTLPLREARWHPTEDLVLYRRSSILDTGGPFDEHAYVVALDGSAPRRIDLASRVHRIEWAPDGDHVVYIGGETGVLGYGIDLRVASLDGGEERVITLPPPPEGASGVGGLLDLAVRSFR